MSLRTSAVPGTFLALLTPAEQGTITELGARRSYARGAVLMYEGDPGDHVIVVQSGRAKISRVEAGGHETLLNIRDPGDILGELAFIDGSPRLASVTAMEPVGAVIITSSVFRKHLETAPRVAVALLEVITRRLRDTTIKRAQFLGSDTIGRLAARIVELTERYGTPGEDGVEIGLALSQDELASWTAASRAGVAKGLQTLRDLGWIETHRRRLVVRDLEALRHRSA